MKSKETPEYLALISSLPVELHLPEGLFYKLDALERKKKQRTLIDRIECYELEGHTISSIEELFRQRLKIIKPEKPIDANLVMIGSEGDYDNSWLTLYIEELETDTEYFTRLKRIRSRIVSARKSAEARASRSDSKKLEDEIRVRSLSKKAEREKDAYEREKDA